MPGWRLICLWVIAPSLAVAACGGTDEAKRGVTEFRARVAQKAYGDIHRAAAAEFRQVGTEEGFVRFMAALDRTLGAWQSADDPAWKVHRGTAGHMVNLTYQSRFAKGAATEEFTWRIERSNPVLLRYNVNSALLITD